MKEDLLEELAEKLGCLYLSDIRYVDRNNAMFRRCVNGIEHGSYSAAQWTEAVTYIIEDYTMSFTSEDEARAYLLTPPEKSFFGK